MKTMCQLYLFMHLFRFAASCRFFFAWQQTHWLNCYFCLSDASCWIIRCSKGKNNQLSVTFLSHRSFLVGCCLCVSGASPPQTAFASCTPKSAAPEVVLTHFLHKHTRAAVAGLRLCRLHPAHIHPTFLFMSTFIYPRKSGGFPPSLELLNLFCVTFCHCRFLKWFSVFRGPRGTVIIQLIMSSCCC